MSKQDFANLTGKFLIASPYTMFGNVYHQSIIYVVHHSDSGSVGFMINRVVNNNIVKSIFKQNNAFDFDLGEEIHVGGPVELSRGFFLHSADYNKNLLYKMEDTQLAISSNAEIASDVNNGRGPKLQKFLIGYTGWAPGEIEEEIKSNLWVVSQPDVELIFAQNNQQKWQTSMSVLGVDIADFAPAFIASC